MVKNWPKIRNLKFDKNGRKVNNNDRKLRKHIHKWIKIDLKYEKIYENRQKVDKI